MGGRPQAPHLYPPVIKALFLAQTLLFHKSVERSAKSIGIAFALVLGLLSLSACLGPNDGAGELSNLSQTSQDIGNGLGGTEFGNPPTDPDQTDIFCNYTSLSCLCDQRRSLCVNRSHELVFDLFRTEFLGEETETGVRLSSLPKPKDGFDYGENGSGRNAILYLGAGRKDLRDYIVSFDITNNGPQAGLRSSYSLEDPTEACLKKNVIRIRARSASESWGAEIGDSSYALAFGTEDCYREGHINPWGIQGRWYFWRDNNIRFDSQKAWETGTRTPILQGESSAIRSDSNQIEIEAIGNRIIVRINNEVVIDYIDHDEASAGGYGSHDFGGIGVEWFWGATGTVDNIKLLNFSQSDD